MKTISQLIKNKQIALFLFVLVTPFASFAQHVATTEEEAASNARTALIGEVAIAVLFIVAVTAFLVYKAKHDKKVREKQLEIMKKVQAAKKRAA
jgi:predicted permease